MKPMNIISHNTRNASKPHECYNLQKDKLYYKLYVKHTLSYKGVDVWNLLETKFNEINSYNIFKKQIKQHFLPYTIDNYHIQLIAILIRHAIKHSLRSIYMCVILKGGYSSEVVEFATVANYNFQVASSF